MGSRYCICLITAPDRDVAVNLARMLVQERLAACVNIVSQVESIYRWQEKIERSNEFLLIVKTRFNLSRDIIGAVKEKHTYSVPEIIFTDIIDGNEDYLDWLGANTLLSSNVNHDKEEEK